jgi:hypothetical protein
MSSASPWCKNKNAEARLAQRVPASPPSMIGSDAPVPGRPWLVRVGKTGTDANPVDSVPLRCVLRARGSGPGPPRPAEARSMCSARRCVHVRCPAAGGTFPVYRQRPTRLLEASAKALIMNCFCRCEEFLSHHATDWAASCGWICSMSHPATCIRPLHGAGRERVSHRATGNTRFMRAIESGLPEGPEEP